jgi:hypothetical protein
MSDEAEAQEVADDPEEDFYEPEPHEIMDGAVLLADPREFFDLTASHAAMVVDGALFVLRRDTFKWQRVEELAPKPSKVTPLRADRPQ